MAKNLRKIISMIIALTLCFSIIATPASAFGFPGWNDDGWGGGTDESDLYEWYEVYVQGQLVASGQGEGGNRYYLGMDYDAGISTDGHMLTWYIRPNGGNAGNFGGTVDLRNYITIPDGFTVEDYTIEESSIEGVNSAQGTAYYDNAIIKITIKTLLTENGEEIEIDEITNVTVNHIYKTYDVYTGETVLDGSTSSSEGSVAGRTYTAVAVPSYNGNAYEQQTADSALTITLQKDASANVINIEYLRTIDTTPAATSVTVNHIYRTYDVYTGLTTEDGSTSSTEAALERDVYTAVAVPSYKGNAYEQQTADSALTITLVADAAANVINIEYLRTIDTTPKATSVTVNHIYRTYDVYTGKTSEDGRKSVTENATEHDVYTAVAVPAYNGNAYVQQTSDSALTITLMADASANVINIEYLRTVDTTPVDYNPVVTVTKIANQKSYREGDTVTWTITVKNVGTDTAYDVVVTDDLTGESWTVAALASGASESFTATLENAPAGTLKNVAVVKWDDKDEIPNEDEDLDDEDEEIVEVRELIDYAPALSVTKIADGKGYKVGDTVTWTITVENVGTDTAYDVVVTDDLTGESWTVAALAPGASENFTATLENVPAGTVKNVVVVNWTDNDEIPDEDEPEEPKTTKDDEIVEVREPINYTPILSVEKVAGKTVYEAGETITWTVTVKNISQHTAHDISIVDELTGDIWGIRMLEPGAEQSFTTSLENAAPGSIKNVVVVTWNDNDEIPDAEEDEIKSAEDEEIVAINDPVPENFTPVLNVIKTAGKDVYGYNEVISWSITVQNVSSYTAYNVRVVDDLTGDSWTIEALEPGAEKIFVTSLANAAPGSIRNVVVVIWEDGDEIPDEEETNEITTVSDEEIVEKEAPVDYAPLVTMTKVAGQETYEIGQTITWTITVMNIGEHPAYGVVVTDELTGDSWTLEVLAPGTQKSFTASLENASEGVVKNVAVVTWTDNDEIPDEDEDEIKTAEDEEIVSVVEPPNPAPVLRIVKTSSKYLFETGETVTWYISVENISDYTAYDVVLTDELTNDRWVIGTLEPGAVRTFATTTRTTEAGSITNVAVVTWTDGDETPDAEETEEIKRGSDDALVIVEDPAPGNDPAPQDDNTVIEDEDVPLADVPKTGDISGVLAAISLISLGGIFLLKKKED